MQGKVLQVVVETSEFIKQSWAIAEKRVIEDFIYFIALVVREPLTGDLVQGTAERGKYGGIKTAIAEKVWA